MSVQVECPDCKIRNSLKNDKCKCGFKLKKYSGKVYWIDYRIEGKRKRERIGKSKTAAEHRLREVLTQRTEERYIEKDKNSLESLSSLKQWYCELSKVKKQASIRRTKVSLKNIIRLLGAGTKINELSLDLIDKYRKKRENEPSRKYPGTNITIATINREISAVRKMLNEAVKYKKISSNPIKEAKNHREDNIRERVLTDTEFDKLHSEASEHIKPILLVAFYEPMRFDEIMKLTWSEVDLKTDLGFIRLPANRVKGKKEGRVIPLHPRVKEALQVLPSRFKGGRVFLKKGKHLYDIRVSFNEAKIKAGIDDFTFHDFRHCAITNLRRAGNDIPTIMKISGHKTMSMFQRYNLVDDEDIQNIKWKQSENNAENSDKQKKVKLE
jgi:integrase